MALRAASMSGRSLGGSLVLLFSATKQESAPAIWSAERSLENSKTKLGKDAQKDIYFCREPTWRSHLKAAQLASVHLQRRFHRQCGLLDEWHHLQCWNPDDVAHAFVNAVRPTVAMTPSDWAHHGQHATPSTSVDKNQHGKMNAHIEGSMKPTRWKQLTYCDAFFVRVQEVVKVLATGKWVELNPSLQQVNVLRRKIAS